MILWPESLPKPTVNYNIKVDTSSIVTKMESGRPRKRRRFTRDFRQMGVSWSLTDAEFGYFQSIFYHVLVSGSEWFTIFLPMGDGLKEYTCRFLGDYQAAYDKVMYWNITAALFTEDETAPHSAISIDELMAVDFDLAAFTAALDSLHTYTHVTMPTLIPA